MDFKKKKEELEKRSEELRRQREQLTQQADQIATELLRIQGEYRLLLKILEENKNAETEAEKEMEKDAEELTEQEVNPEDLIPDKLDATPNLGETNE